MSVDTSPAGKRKASALTQLAQYGGVSSRNVHSMNSTSPLFNNYRTSQFFDLVRLIEDLSELDADSEFHIAGDVKKRAVKVLYLLRGMGDIDLPKVLPEGEECLSLTWENHPWKTFLTVYPDELEGITYNRETGIRCRELLGDEEKAVDIERISRSISVAPKPTTADLP